MGPKEKKSAGVANGGSYLQAERKSKEKFFRMRRGKGRIDSRVNRWKR